MKRFAALLIVCAMVLCLLSVSAFAAGVVSPQGQVTPPVQPDVTSPQTGMGGSLVIVAVVMCVAMFAAVVTLRKVSVG